MSTNCASLAADTCSFCNKNDSILYFSGNTQANFIEELTSTSKNLEDLLNIDKPYFEQKYVRHPSEIQLQITKAPF